MLVNNAYASIYVRILMVRNGEFPQSTPAGTTPPFDQSISRFTKWMEAKLWEKIDYLVGNLYLKGSIPKHIQS
jgi:hypothetical protein